MNKIKVCKTTTIYLILIAVLLIPTYWRLFRPGIFSMQDMHVFRLYEYEKCISDGQIPCRWSPGAAFGYGQPVFNFYGQLPYLLGEGFRLLQFSFIDSLKGLFIMSLLVSAWGMFLLGKQLWGSNLAGLISAMVYVYAPYRAVDVWVRGALPEALSFMFFPFIVYFFNDYVKRKELMPLLFFGISFTLLVLNHNLSAFMFLFFLVPWAAYLLSREKGWNLIPSFLSIGVLILGLASFYLIPLIGESNLVSLQKTVQGYFDFHNHFVTLKQLLLSRYWGYGASLWGDDDRLSLSVGQVQWILPFLISLALVFKRSLRKNGKFFILLSIGWLMLWFTHNKSTFFWNAFSPMAYVQFPWRFLGMAVFSFALASGLAAGLIRERLHKFAATAVIIAALFALNIPYFFEDLWFSIKDSDQFTGPKYEQIEGLGATDYWPNYGDVIPSAHAPNEPLFIEGEGSGTLIEKKSSSARYELSVKKTPAVVQIPIAYFPGWKANGGSKDLDLKPSGEMGLISVKLDEEVREINLKFTNTSIRTIANTISLVSLGILISVLVFVKVRKL